MTPLQSIVIGAGAALGVLALAVIGMALMSSTPDERGVAFYVISVVVDLVLGGWAYWVFNPCL